MISYSLNFFAASQKWFISSPSDGGSNGVGGRERFASAKDHLKVRWPYKLFASSFLYSFTFFFGHLKDHLKVVRWPYKLRSSQGQLEEMEKLTSASGEVIKQTQAQLEIG